MSLYELVIYIETAILVLILNIFIPFPFLISMGVLKRPDIRIIHLFW